MPSALSSRARCLWLAIVVVGILLAAPGSAAAVTISGNAMLDERGTAWQGCAPLTQNVNLKLVGTATPIASTSCDPLTGAFNFTGVTIPAPGQTIAIWFIHPTARGVLYTKANTTSANITGLTPTQDRVWIRSEQPAGTFNLDEVRNWSSDEVGASDVPITDTGWSTDLPTTAELHVDDGITLDQGSYDLITGALHVSAGATYDATDWLGTYLRAAGTSTTCTFGPGVIAPMCIEPSGSFVQSNTNVIYEVASGEYAITPITARYFDIEGGPDSLGIIGTGVGQTLTAQMNMNVLSSITSDPWGTDIVTPRLQLLMDPSESWTGDSALDIDVSRAFIGEGTIDLPQATVNLRGVTAKVDFGPLVFADAGEADQEPSWAFRRVIMSNGGYSRHVYGTAGVGSTYNSGGGDDRIVAVASGFEAEYALYALPTGAGGSSWGVRKFDANGAVVTAWDNFDGTPGDDLVIIDSAGADTPSAIFAYDSFLLVAGTYNGDFRIQALGYGTGATDTGFDTDGIFTWSNGGTEQLEGLAYSRDVWGNEMIVAAGSSITANTWEVLTMSVYGGAFTRLTWNGGGAGQARVGGVCADAGQSGQVFVVGSVGAAGSRDWAARRLDNVLGAWGTFGGAASWTWDAGGTEDLAVGCGIVDDRLAIAGTTGTGASDDWRVRGFLGDGTVDTTYATAGILSINGAGDDNVHVVRTDPQDWNTEVNNEAQGPGNIVIGGGNGTNGVIRRVDHDGQLDTTWGTNGTITIAGSESVRALDWNDDSEIASFSRIGKLFVGVRDPLNGGQSHLREYDYFGDLQADTLAGTIRVMGTGGLEGGSVHTSDTFQVGIAADAGNTLFDAESGDVRIVTDGKFDIKSRGRYSASSSRSLVVHNDFNVGGTFWGNTGAVLLPGGAFRSVFTLSGTVQFHDLRIEATTKMVSFDETNPVPVKGVFYVRGTSCASPVQLRSNTAGNQWDLNLAGGGSIDVDFAAIDDSRVVGGSGSVNSGFDLGNTTNWLFGGGCAAPTYLNAPNGLNILGQYHPQNVSTTNFSMDWFNRSGTNVDRGDVEVYSSPTTNQEALWRLDGNGADASGNARTLGPTAGVSYVTGRHGQAASMTAASNGLGGGDWDLADDFTIDGWIRTDLSTAEAGPDIIYKGGGGQVNYHLGFNNTNDTLTAAVTGSANTAGATISVPAADVIDDQWHHLAMTFRDGLLRLYADGVLVGSDRMAPTVTDLGAWTTNLGWRLGGELDDWRLANIAYEPDAIRGFYRTGRMHAEEVWDFYAADDNGVGTALGATYGNNGRPPVTYAGPALDANGARYWARARWRTTAGGTPANSWTLWSEFDWFETSQSTTVSLPSGTSLNLGTGATLPGVDAVGTTTFQVTTDNAHGYTAYVTGPSDTWGMSDGLPGATHQIPGRGSPAALQAWAAGTPGYFGLAVLSATGGKDTARWGTGTLTTDLNTLNWGAPWKTQQLLLHSRTAYDPAAQSIVTAVRVNAATNQDPGQYATTLTFTAVPNV